MVNDHLYLDFFMCTFFAMGSSNHINVLYNSKLSISRFLVFTSRLTIDRIAFSLSAEEGNHIRVEGSSTLL